MNGDHTLMLFHLFQLIRYFFRIMHRSIASFHSLFQDNGTKIDCKNPKETVHMIYELVE